MARTFSAPTYTTLTQLNGVTKRKLSTASPGTTDSLATKSPAVTLAAPASYYLSPEAVATAGTLNVVGTAAGIGWALVPSDPTTLVPLNTDGLTLNAGTFTVAVVAARDTAVTSADQVCTFTAILFRASANATTFAQELGRQASASVTMTATKTSFPITITTGAATFAPGEVLWLEIFAATTSTSATGSTASYSTNSTTGVAVTSTTAGYSINYKKVLADAVSVGDSLARRYTGGRSFSDNVPVSESLARSVSFPRSMADTLPVVSDSTVRLYVANRAIGDAVAILDAVARRYIGSRALADAVTISDTLTRKNTYARALTDSLSAGGGGATYIRPILIFED